MSNVIQGNFEKRNLQELAENLMFEITESADEHRLNVPEVLGVLFLVGIQIVEDAKEAESEG